MHDEGSTVLYGRCDPDLGVPYQPFIEALGYFVDACTDEELAAATSDWSGELTRIVPEVARRLPDVPQHPSADLETERYRLFQAVGALLTRASESRPVVLVLEDLHWATKPTILLFRHLATSVVPGAVLLVATYRNTDLVATAPLSEALADLSREPGVRRLPLTGLDQSEVVSLIESAEARSFDEADHAAALGLWRDTDGNPFFVTEILRHLAEAGGSGRPGQTMADGGFVVPESVREVLARRIARLSPGVNRALAIAAVIGRDFELSLASTASQLPEEEMLDLLEEACGAAFVTEVPGHPGRFTFSHALIRLALYDQLGLARRAFMHRRVAEALEAQGPASSVPVPALAHHWFAAGAAGDWSKAVRYSRQAGDAARAELAYEEAAVHFERAVTAVQGDDRKGSSLRCDLLLALGDAQRIGGDQRYRATMREAAAVARDLHDPERLTLAALGSARMNAWFAEGGRVDEALVALYEEALSVLPEGDSAPRARLKGLIAAELVWTRERERRSQLCDEATAMARRLGDPTCLAHVLATKVGAVWDPTTLDERLDLAAELTELATQLDDLDLVMRALTALIVCLFESGEFARGRAELAEAERLAREPWLPFWNWCVTMRQTALLLLEVSPQAEESIYAGFALGQRCGQPDAATAMSSQLYVLWWDQGRLPEMVGMLANWVDQFPAIPTTRAALAHAYAMSGNLPAAREHFDLMAGQDGFGLPLDFVWSPGMALLTDTCAALGDSARAGVLYELFLPFAHQVVVGGTGQYSLGSVSRSLGVLAAMMGRWDDAQAHFEDALAVNRRIGAWAFLVRTQRAYAEMLLDRDGPGDAGTARDLVEEALAAAEALQLGQEVPRLEDIAGRLG